MSTWLAHGKPVIDLLLGEGFGPGKLAVFIGPAGSGKTILGMHFLLKGLEKGETVLRISGGSGNTPLKEAYNFEEKIQARLADKELLEEHFLLDLPSKAKLARLKAPNLPPPRKPSPVGGAG